jgi:hypothetical protein
MQTSRYFERTLFYDRSPAADEYYKRSASLIFEKDSARSVIEVRLQPSSDVSLVQEAQKSNESKHDAKSGAHFRVVSQKKPEKGPRHTENSECTKSRRDSFSDDEDTWSLSSKASSTAVPIGIDEHRGGSPPSYPGIPKLAVVTLDGDVGRLQDFIKVSQMTVIYQTPLRCCAQKTNEDFRVLYVMFPQNFTSSQYVKGVGSANRFIATP